MEKRAADLHGDEPDHQEGHDPGGDNNGKGGKVLPLPGEVPGLQQAETDGGKEDGLHYGGRGAKGPADEE